MKNFIEDGKAINYTPTAAVTGGSAVVLGAHIGIAATDIAANDTGAVSLEGVYELKAESAVAFAIGDDLYWDATNSQLTKTAGAVKAGMAFAAKASADTTAQVKLG